MRGELPRVQLVGCAVELKASRGAHRPKWVTPHAFFSYLEKSNETPHYRYPNMAGQNACFSCTEVNFMRAEYMMDVLEDKAVLRLEFWPAYRLY